MIARSHITRFSISFSLISHLSPFIKDHFHFIHISSSIYTSDAESVSIGSTGFFFKSLFISIIFSLLICLLLSTQLSKKFFYSECMRLKMYTTRERERGLHLKCIHLDESKLNGFPSLKFIYYCSKLKDWFGFVYIEFSSFCSVSCFKLTKWTKRTITIIYAGSADRVNNSILHYTMMQSAIKSNICSMETCSSFIYSFGSVFSQMHLRLTWMASLHDCMVLGYVEQKSLLSIQNTCVSHMRSGTI